MNEQWPKRTGADVAFEDLARTVLAALYENGTIADVSRHEENIGVISKALVQRFTSELHK